MGRTMTAAEISDLLGRNSEVSGRVTAFENIVDMTGYDQQPSTVLGPFVSAPLELPIPSWGYAFRDAVYGNVVIFPDASGLLRYTCDLPAGLVEEIQQPPFVSPTGNSWSQTLKDLQDAIEKLLGSVVVGLVVYGIVTHVIDKK
jgi:hypothetical protein